MNHFLVVFVPVIDIVIKSCDDGCLSVTVGTVATARDIARIILQFTGHMMIWRWH